MTLSIQTTPLIARYALKKSTGEEALLALRDIAHWAHKLIIALAKFFILCSASCAVLTLE